MTTALRGHERRRGDGIPWLRSLCRVSTRAVGKPRTVPAVETLQRTRAPRMASARLTNMSSDTSTRPCFGMRKAMAAAEVGDEQKGEDRQPMSAPMSRLLAQNPSCTKILLPSTWPCAAQVPHSCRPRNILMFSAAILCSPVRGFVD